MGNVPQQRISSKVLPLMGSTIDEIDMRQMNVLGSSPARRCRVCLKRQAPILKSCLCSQEEGFHQECFEQLMQGKLNHGELEPRKEEGRWSYQCGECGQKIRFKCEEEIGQVEYQRWFYPFACILMSLIAIFIGTVLRNRSTIAISLGFLFCSGYICWRWVQTDIRRATKLLHLQILT